MTFHGEKGSNCRQVKQQLAWVLKCVFTVALHCCLISLRTWALLSSKATTDISFFTDRIRGEGERLMILWRGSLQLPNRSHYTTWQFHTTQLCGCDNLCFEMSNRIFVLPQPALPPNPSSTGGSLKETFWTCIAEEMCISFLYCHSWCCTNSLSLLDVRSSFILCFLFGLSATTFIFAALF